MRDETRIEYATDRKSRKAARNRLVKLPGQSGFQQRYEAPEAIARRIQIEVRERRLKRAEQSVGQ